MSLDETSLAIGRLQAAQEATAGDVAKLSAKVDGVDAKLDKLLVRSDRLKLTFKHWAAILLGASAGGGGIAHALRKMLE